MSLNKIMLDGRIPWGIDFKEGKNTEFANFRISVKRRYKEEGAKYAKEDIINCKAFGKNAININKFFSENDSIIIIGRIEGSEKYEDANGNEKWSQVSVIVEEFEFPSTGNGNSNSENDTEEETTAPKKHPFGDRKQGKLNKIGSTKSLKKVSGGLKI